MNPFACIKPEKKIGKKCTGIKKTNRQPSFDNKKNFGQYISDARFLIGFVITQQKKIYYT